VQEGQMPWKRYAAKQEALLVYDKEPFLEQQ